MLNAFFDKSREIKNLEVKNDGLHLVSDKGRLRIFVVNENCVRVTYTERDSFSTEDKPGIVCGLSKALRAQEDCEDNCKDNYSDDCNGKCQTPDSEQATYAFVDEKEHICITTAKLKIAVDKMTGSIEFFDSQNNSYLKESEKDSHILEEYMSYILSDEGTVVTEKIKTADGEKTVVKSATREENGKLYHTRLSLVWDKDEALYGFGQNEEGIFNLRKHTLYLHQANRKIIVPMLVSTKGYGLLMNTYSPLIFNDNEYGSYIYTEADDELDYFFIAGNGMKDVIKGYRQLTGKAAMLPKWAYGYIQSQERYETAEEICSVAKEYRRRNIGIDGIVLDWSSWEDGLWGQKTLDKSRFPKPEAMIDELHKNDIHFMISIWPNMSGNCDNFREFKENGLILPGSEVYNALDAEGRKMYWKQTEEGLYKYGVDSWWCDSSEPFTPEWNHMIKPEPSAMYHEYVTTVNDHLPAQYSNAYALFHAQAVYEGQRGSSLSEFAGKRVLNLTRSTWMGGQRYGTVMWSGDIAATWDTLKRQIAAGLNFSAAGIPYWTTDIGAFFVKNGMPWYWKGNYNDTTNDEGYRELFTRWYQWAAFLPMFRGHGTDCRRELWFMGNEAAILNANRLRYRLMPYIYSMAGMVWLRDESIIKALAFDFSDSAVHDIADQYMFGDSLMICPVTEPMYFEAGGKPIETTRFTRKVYLPKDCGWYDFYSEKYYDGGQWIDAEAPIDRIPVFVKEGSIIPFAEVSDRTCRCDISEYVVYSGKDTEFTLYSDAGDGYGYENGEYELCELIWTEETHRLTDKMGIEYQCKIVKKI